MTEADYDRMGELLAEREAIGDERDWAGASELAELEAMAGPLSCEFCPAAGGGCIVCREDR